MPEITLEEQFAKTRAGDAGIIGDPVIHSLSPAMHNAAFEALWEKENREPPVPKYHKFRVSSDQLVQAIHLMKQHQLIGINVTVPHKRPAYELVESDELGKRVRAINTIANTPKGWMGYNTDGYGFERALTLSLQFEAKGKNALVLGAGGTGAVIVYSLLRLGAHKIYWWNRKSEKVTLLIQDLNESRLQPLLNNEQVHNNINKMDLIVNATSVGLADEDGMPMDDLKFRQGQYVFDVIYHRQTQLMEAARSAGAKVIGGYEMLLHQGVKSFEIWTGHNFEGIMRVALNKSLEEKGIKIPCQFDI